MFPPKKARKYNMATGTHDPVKPNPKAPIGQGGRFAALEDKLSDEPGVDNPGALAASIGRKKFGKDKFQNMAAKGR